MPSHARPPDSTSSVVTVLARTPGWRYVTPVTRVPSWMRSVFAARYAERRVALEHVERASPIIGSWKKWSITHSDEPGLLGGSRDPAQGRAERGGAVGKGEPGDLQSESHAPSSCARPGLLCKACRGSGLQSRPTEGASRVTAPASGSHRRSSTRSTSTSSHPRTSTASCTRSRGSRRARVTCGSHPGCWRPGTEGAHVEHRAQGVVVDVDRPGDGDARPAEEQQPRHPDGDREERAEPPRRPPPPPRR